MYKNGITVPSRRGFVTLSFGDEFLARIHDDHGRNQENVHLLITSWIALLADTPLSSISGHKPSEVYYSFFTRLSNDLFGTIAQLSSLAESITRSIRNDDGVFSIDDFIGPMKDTPIFKEYLHWYHTNDSEVLTFILSFLQFGTKLYYEDESLDVTALRGWLEIEEKLSQLTLPTDLTRALRAVMEELFSDWSTGPFLPVHGSGSVAEPGLKGVNAKNTAFPWDPKISYLFEVDRSFDPQPARFHPEGEIPIKRPVSRNVSRLKFVPKNWKKTRSICMEPRLFQWAQQGVRLWYEDHLSTSLIRHNVTIQDQGNNQEGARFGSQFSTVDTIDLSAASDSVAWNLVKTIFPAKVAKFLAATRTRYVELPDGSIHEAEKFAPMGSALCFPVQSTIYAAVVIAASIAMAHSAEVDFNVVSDLDIRKEFRRLFYRDFTFSDAKYQPFRIYGDDIVCDSRTTPHIIRSLRQLGFTVNEEKSFVDGAAYRESCGKHYCDGADVTPYVFKARALGRKASITFVGSIIDAANRARMYGYTHLRKHLIHVALFYPILNVRRDPDTGMNPILFSEDADQSMAILCDNPKNTHLKVREYARDMESVNDTRYWYQRTEIRSITGAAEHKVEHLRMFDNYDYVQWQRSRYHGVEDDGDSPSFRGTDAFGIRVRWRWTPA